jgi:branched-chain amino acid transport system substrate-binding protein
VRRLVLASLALVGLGTSALAQFSDGKIVVWVTGDLSGVVADVGGPGSILASRMAVADFGGTVDGVPVEIVTADHQNKSDVASGIAREWFDPQGVDVIVELTRSGVVFGLMSIATEKKRALMISGAARVEITGARCSPYARDRRHLLAGAGHGGRPCETADRLTRGKSRQTSSHG